MLRPNHLYPPFDKPAVRRALMGAIDQKEFMIAMMGEDTSLWSVPCGFFPPISPLASDAGMSALTGKRDYAAVKTGAGDRRLSGREGGADGGRPTSRTNYPLAEVAADMLKRVGMNVDYQATDWGTVVQRRALTKPPAEGGWNLFCTGFSGLDFFTPASHLPLRGNGKGAWFGWPNDPKIEALREAWFNAPDLAAQKKIGAEIQTSGVRERAVLSARVGAAADRVPPGHHGRAGGLRDLLERAPHLSPTRSSSSSARRCGPAAGPAPRWSCASRPPPRSPRGSPNRCSCRPAGSGGHGPSEASVMAALLEARGVPAERVLLEETGTDTLSSVRAVARVAAGARDRRAPVFAASSLYHLPRCMLLLRLAGVPARAASPPAVPAATRWWRRWYWWLREVPAIPYDLALLVVLRVSGRA